MEVEELPDKLFLQVMEAILHIGEECVMGTDAMRVYLTFFNEDGCLSDFNSKEEL